jgi:hypothetical protein
MKVYQAIAAVMADIAKEGIAKDRKNEQQGYRFRGIDDVYNAMSPILAEHKLVILPRVMSRSVTERQNRNGNALFYVTVEVEFDLIHAEDGSKHTIKTFGEAMDSADKATNKAMSAAYKYAAMQAFCIPTEGDNDADSTTHEVAPRDWRKEARELSAIVQGITDPPELDTLWKTERVKAFRREAPEDLVTALTGVFAEHKRLITPKKEAA